MTELFEKLLDMSLTASLVILAVLGARYLLKNAPKAVAYALWSVVLFRLLCPVAFSAPMSVLNVAVRTVDTAAVVDNGATSAMTYLEAPEQAEVTFVEADRPERPSATAQSAPADKPLQWMDMAAMIWLAGVAVMVLHSLASYYQLSRRLIGAMRLRENIYLADYIDTPFVLGIFQPRIYLPSTIPGFERQYILAHERQHIRRGDHIIKLLAYAALCLHWFNPLVWVAFFQAGKDMEMSCDEAVLKHFGGHVRADYAQSLLRLAMNKHIVSGTPLAFGEGDTKGRVKNMAKWKKPTLWVSVVSGILCIAVLAACATNPVQPSEPAPTEPVSMGEAPKQANGYVSKIGLSFDLPMDYEVKVDDSYNLEFWHGVEQVGGANAYAKPGMELEGRNMIEWMEALGVPKAVSGNYDTMASNSKYGDLEATFFHPDEGETIHHFFITEDAVEELWFHQDKVDAMTQTAILQTVTFGSEASVSPDLPADVSPMEEIDALKKCKAALDHMRTYDSYSVKTDVLNWGDAVLNSSSQINYWADGENWLYQVRIPMDGYLDGEPVWESIFAEMMLDGQFYDNMGNSSLDENREVYWNKAEQTLQDQTPWLYRFQWEDSKIEYVSTVAHGSGQKISLVIHEPYDLRRPAEEQYDSYPIAFIFDGSGNFLRAVADVTYKDDREGDWGQTLTMTVHDLGDTFNKEVIEYERQRVEKQGA